MPEEMQKTMQKIAQGAYHAYGQVTNFKNFQGNPMPDWEQLPEKIQEAWRAAVRYVYVITAPDEEIPDHK